jgi:branched-chain amino acid aminotransferase
MTNQLGVLPPREAKIFTILSPVGPYFPTGFSAIKIICSENIMRSWPGGFGYAKLGANYGPTLQYFKQIKEMGYQQILWLIDDVVTEVGVMNFFIFWTNKQGEKELITCPLDGTILPGVIRDSVISLCREWNIKVTERHFTIHEVIDSLKEGRFHEAFGTGTAAIICPIKEFSFKDTSYSLFKDPNQNVGDLGKKLYDHLLDIQTGVIKHPWSRSISH